MNRGGYIGRMTSSQHPHEMGNGYDNHEDWRSKANFFQTKDNITVELEN